MRDELARYYHAIDLLTGMIQRPSISREEASVADFLQQTWQADGYTVHRKGNNLWIKSSRWDETKPTILLNSHIDTVRPVSGWSSDPFTAVEQEDSLFGLGSNDAGASVVSLYSAFTALTAKEQPYNLLFLASAEEEISGQEGVESALRELPPITFGVVGEPTAMQPAVAEKGLMVLDAVSHGRSGHAARNEGVNAITSAIEAIEWFHHHLFPRSSDLLGPVKMTVTMIHAGTQHNTIPDRCTFTVDVRTNECYSNEEVLQQIRDAVRCEVTARSTRLNSSSIDLNHPIVERARMMGRTPYGSPTLSDQALMPFPTIKMGPGESARSHTADEYIRLPEIREAIALYIRLLDNLVVRK